MRSTQLVGSSSFSSFQVLVMIPQVLMRFDLMITLPEIHPRSSGRKTWRSKVDGSSTLGMRLDLLSSVWLVGIKGSILIPWTVIFLFCSSLLFCCSCWFDQPYLSYAILARDLDPFDPVLLLPPCHSL